jgi:hypothetical protein
VWLWSRARTKPLGDSWGPLSLSVMTGSIGAAIFPTVTVLSLKCEISCCFILCVCARVYSSVTCEAWTQVGRNLQLTDWSVCVSVCLPLSVSLSLCLSGTVQNTNRKMVPVELYAAVASNLCTRAQVVHIWASRKCHELFSSFESAHFKTAQVTADSH